jgi:hypothetical protein
MFMMRLFENRMLRCIFVVKRGKLIMWWKRLYNEELYDFYSSPDFIRWIKSLRLRWSEHVAGMGGRIGACRVMVAVT